MDRRDPSTWKLDVSCSNDVTRDFERLRDLALNLRECMPGIMIELDDHDRSFEIKVLDQTVVLALITPDAQGFVVYPFNDEDGMLLCSEKEIVDECLKYQLEATTWQKNDSSSKWWQFWKS